MKAILIPCLISASLTLLAAEPIPTVRVREFDKNNTLKEASVMNKVIKTDAEWKKQLTPEQYRITRNKGTEPPFCSRLTDQAEPGIYSCVCCGLPIFSSEAKFHSGTGWPSFFKHYRTSGRKLRHGSHRNPLCPLRCPSRPRFSRWTQTHRTPLLPQRRRTGVYREKIESQVQSPKLKVEGHS